MNSKKQQMKYLVTGGAGFIGSHLCEEMVRRGAAVTVIDDLSTGSRYNIAALLYSRRIAFYKGSVLDEALVRRLVRQCDVVYHLAAAVGMRYILEHPLRSLETNLEGTRTVLAAAKRYGKKVVLASSSAVYGKHHCRPICEDDDRVLGPTTIGWWSYSDAKAVDEFLALAYAKEHGLPVVIARLFNTVGPRQVGRYGMVLPRFVEAALAHKPIVVYGDGSQIRTFTYIADAVKPLIDLGSTKKAEGEIFNVGSFQPISIKDLAKKVKKYARSRSPIVYLSYEKAYGKNATDFEEIPCRIPNITKLKNVLGYGPRYTVNDIVDRTIEYFRFIAQARG